jgi:hypothetical protein
MLHMYSYTLYCSIEVTADTYNNICAPEETTNQKGTQPIPPAVNQCLAPAGSVGHNKNVMWQTFSSHPTDFRFDSGVENSRIGLKRPYLPQVVFGLGCFFLPRTF